MHALSLALLLFALFISSTAHAYIGPGVGAGTLAVVLGIVSSVFFAFIGIVWYPIKRLLRKRRKSSQIENE